MGRTEQEIEEAYQKAITRYEQNPTSKNKRRLEKARASFRETVKQK